MALAQDEAEEFVDHLVDRGEIAQERREETGYIELLDKRKEK